MTNPLVCVCLIAALTGIASAAKPAAGTPVVEVRVATQYDVNEVKPRLNNIKEAIATNLCDVPVADIHLTSVEPDFSDSGEVQGSRVVATCTPAAGQLDTVRESCIAAARQADSAAWADKLDVVYAGCGETVATAGTGVVFKPTSGTPLLEVRVANDYDVKQVTSQLDAMKEAIATNLCDVPVADVNITSVEADFSDSGEAQGSRVVATCTPTAGQLTAVRESCIAAARQVDSAAWADSLNINYVSCGQTFAASGATMGAAATTNASSSAEPASGAAEGLPATDSTANSTGTGDAAAAEGLPATGGASTATATGDAAAAAAPGSATAAPAAPAATAAPKSGAGAAAASTFVMAVAGAAVLVLV